MGISVILKRVMYRYPIFIPIIMNLDVKKDNTIPAVACTDGKNIYYSDNLENLSNEEQEFVIAHELFHIVLNHLNRNDRKDRDLLNYCEDGIINQLLLKDGLSMPDGCVNIKDALNYSVDELYIKYLPYINEIKKWMQKNTYHLPMIDESLNSEGLFGTDLESIEEANEQIKNSIRKSFENKLKQEATKIKDEMAGNEHTKLGKLGNRKSFFNWQELLKKSLLSKSEDRTLFYEVEMDGIVRREVKEEADYSECEIVVDSSGSMNLVTIKMILRECKNILASSKIKVGFCDMEFYGFNDIKSEEDIDNLELDGGGGTDFETMVKSFSKQVDNKIIITDGYGTYPQDQTDILWIIISCSLSAVECYTNLNDNINYIYIDELEFVCTNENNIKKLKK